MASARDVRESTRMRAGVGWEEGCLRLEAIGGALAVSTLGGELVGATPAARALLARLGVPCEDFPQPLPTSLWRDLAMTPFGEATTWRPPPVEGHVPACLGCTRYPLGGAHLLLLMREVSDKQIALSQRLHRQRLEATGRLVATIAHDLRAPLASVVFNADVLASLDASIGPDAVRPIVEEVRAGAARLRSTIDGLLDFARLGPPVATTVSLAQIFDHVGSLLRPALRERGHTLDVRVEPPADRVQGNALVIEQIFVNLVLNAAEACGAPTTIGLRARNERVIEPKDDRRRSAPAWDADATVVRVSNPGPPLPPEVRARLFEPFFTTKANGTGLGLTTAREAARELGGDLWFEPDPDHVTFAVMLVGSDAPLDDAGGAP